MMQMYEVFYNDCKLVFTDVAVENIGEQTKATVFVNNIDDIANIASSFLEGNIKFSNIVGDLEKLWPAFTRMFHSIPAAGGLVEQNGFYLFIFRRGKWDLPKGKIDEGETPQQAALREVEEETGLHKLTICRTLPSTWHLYKSPYKNSKGEIILKQTHWFLMNSDSNQKLIPQTEEDIERIEWVKPENVDEILQNAWANIENLLGKIELITKN